MSQSPPVPAGWYPDPQTGHQRWWDGAQWGPFAPPANPMHQQPVQVQMPATSKSYVRTQTGHSLTLHILLIFVLVGFVTIPYYSFSPNHYWHL